MKQKEICKEEINLFYLWLCGTIGKEKGEDKRLVYLCCPAERDTLLRLFLAEYKAEHRYNAFKKALQPSTRIIKSVAIISPCTPIHGMTTPK